MRGPMNFSTNEECGFLIDGYKSPPMIMTPYNPPYYIKLIEDYGMKKVKDLYAYVWVIPDKLPEKVDRVADISTKRGIRVRPIQKRDFKYELKRFKEVYNSSWQNNWGFVPLTDDDIDYLGSKLKAIVVPELTIIAEKGSEPVGFLGMVPDYNFVLRKMKGKLNPVTAMKAFFYLKKRKDIRFLLLGIKSEYRNKGIDALLFREGLKGLKKGGYRRVEFSWILEDNIPVQMIIKMMGGRLYKKYRIYEKEI